MPIVATKLTVKVKVGERVRATATTKAASLSEHVYSTYSATSLQGILDHARDVVKDLLKRNLSGSWNVEAGGLSYQVPPCLRVDGEDDGTRPILNDAQFEDMRSSTGLKERPLHSVSVTVDTPKKAAARQKNVETQSGLKDKIEELGFGALLKVDAQHVSCKCCHQKVKKVVKEGRDRMDVKPLLRHVADCPSIVSHISGLPEDTAKPLKATVVGAEKKVKEWRVVSKEGKVRSVASKSEAEERRLAAVGCLKLTDMWKRPPPAEEQPPTQQPPIQEQETPIQPPVQEQETPIQQPSFPASYPAELLPMADLRRRCYHAGVVFDNTMNREVLVRALQQAPIQQQQTPIQHPQQAPSQQQQTPIQHPQQAPSQQQQAPIQQQQTPIQHPQQAPIQQQQTPIQHPQQAPIQQQQTPIQHPQQKLSGKKRAIFPF